MRRLCAVLVALVCLWLPLCAGLAADDRPRLPEHETIVYDIKWLGIQVGTATASIKGIEKINGRDAYHLEITARTNDFCSSIYKVEDRYVSYMDVEDLCTVRHEVYRREGRYKKDAITDFDQAAGKAHFRSLVDKSERTVDIAPRTHDPVSMIYYFRLLPVEADRQEEFSVYNNEAVYKLYGVIGKKEIFRIPHIGKKEVFCVRPYAMLDGELVKKGQARVYFSYDEKQIPVVGIAKGPVFTEVVGYLAKEE